MAQQNEEHFETIDSNKAKAYEEQKTMRKECKEYIETCGTFHLQEIHSEIKRMKRNKI
tara:strand:- start:1145 stop:1318 length:174 start_codon:yes stop_codon:yes gene_type:complete